MRGVVESKGRGEEWFLSVKGGKEGGKKEARGCGEGEEGKGGCGKKTKKEVRGCGEGEEGRGKKRKREEKRT